MSPTKLTTESTDHLAPTPLRFGGWAPPVEGEVSEVCCPVGSPQLADPGLPTVPAKVRGPAHPLRQAPSMGNGQQAGPLLSPPPAALHRNTVPEAAPLAPAPRSLQGSPAHPGAAAPAPQTPAAHPAPALTCRPRAAPPHGTGSLGGPILPAAPSSPVPPGRPGPAPRERAPGGAGLPSPAPLLKAAGRSGVARELAVSASPRTVPLENKRG